MEEIIQLALIGDLEDDIPVLMLQTLSERTGKRRIRSMEFARFNIDNFSPEDCLLNFRFDTDGLVKLLAALNLPRSITVEDRTVRGIPIVYILVTVPSMIPWDKLDSWFLPWCHIVGAVCPWIGSFLYHLFMNLERGENIYYRLLQVDMLGIWISQSFGALPMVSASVFCLHWALRWLIFSFYCLLSVWGLYKALTAWSPWERRLCFLLPFVMRILLCALRYSKVGGGDPESLVHVILQDFVSALGGAIGAMHIPEKWFPGTVDLYLNSHNIMHVLVVMAVYSMHQATVLDLVWMASVDCKAEHQKQLDVSSKTEL